MATQEIFIIIFTIFAGLLIANAMTNQVLDSIFVKTNRIISNVFSFEFYLHQFLPAMLCLFIITNGICKGIDIYFKYSGMVLILKLLLAILYSSCGVVVSRNFSKWCDRLNAKFEAWEFRYKNYVLGSVFIVLIAYFLVDSFTFIQTQG